MGLHLKTLTKLIVTIMPVVRTEPIRLFVSSVSRRPHCGGRRQHHRGRSPRQKWTFRRPRRSGQRRRRLGRSSCRSGLRGFPRGRRPRLRPTCPYGPAAAAPALPYVTVAPRWVVNVPPFEPAAAAPCGPTTAAPLR